MSPEMRSLIKNEAPHLIVLSQPLKNIAYIESKITASNSMTKVMLQKG